MDTRPALRRLADLYPDTEIWWDSSPLVLDAWHAERAAAWAGRTDLLAALAELTFTPDGVFRGSTTNPPLALEALQRDPAGWLGWLRDRVPAGTPRQEKLWVLYGEVLHRGAARLLPLWEASYGRFGQICGQVDPRSLHDAAAMVSQGRRLYAETPNVMVKLPATAEGIQALHALTALGISTNATLGFSVSQILATADAARMGLAQARADGVDLRRTRSMATLMLGRLEDAPAFAEQAGSAGVELTESDRRWAGIAVARKAYALLAERGYETTLLLASMRLGPTVDGSTEIWHLARLGGGKTVLTVFPNILAAFVEGYASRPLHREIEMPVPEAVLDRLLRVPYFRQAYEEDAVEPEAFAALPGVVLTGAAFATSMQAIEDMLPA
jgi:transaldolase